MERRNEKHIHQKKLKGGSFNTAKKPRRIKCLGFLNELVASNLFFPLSTEVGVKVCEEGVANRVL